LHFITTYALVKIANNIYWPPTQYILTFISILAAFQISFSYFAFHNYICSG
jgi:hypothetical protein